MTSRILIFPSSFQCLSAVEGEHAHTESWNRFVCSPDTRFIFSLSARLQLSPLSTQSSSSLPGEGREKRKILQSHGKNGDECEFVDFRLSFRSHNLLIQIESKGLSFVSSFIETLIPTSADLYEWKRNCRLSPSNEFHCLLAAGMVHIRKYNDECEAIKVRMNQIQPGETTPNTPHIHHSSPSPENTYDTRRRMKWIIFHDVSHNKFVWYAFIRMTCYSIIFAYYS